MDTQHNSAMSDRRNNKVHTIAIVDSSKQYCQLRESTESKQAILREGPNMLTIQICQYIPTELFHS